MINYTNGSISILIYSVKNVKKNFQIFSIFLQFIFYNLFLTAFS